MKMIIIKIFLSIAFILFGFPNIAFANADACWQHPVFVTPYDSVTASKLLHALSKENQRYLIVEGATLYAVYAADISNSHKPENVFLIVNPAPNGGTAYVKTFQKKGQDWIYIGEPKFPDDAGLGGYLYPLKDAFITQLCGKNYVSFNYYDSKIKSIRNTYLWRNDKVEGACDNDWLNYERASFKKQYDQKNYADAYDQLKFYSEKCKDKINPEIYLWMQNDLAFTAIKNDDLNTGKVILNKIQKSPAFINASSKLKESVAHNLNLCQKKLTSNINSASSKTVDIEAIKNTCQCPYCNYQGKDLSNFQPGIVLLSDKDSVCEDENRISCDFTGTNFSRAILKNSNFAVDLNLTTCLTKAKFRKANFSHANLSDSSFGNNDFTRANFSAANLKNSHFKTCDFSEANFSKASLDNAIFEMHGSNGAGSIFQYSNFSYAHLARTELNGNFNFANFSYAYFYKTSITSMNEDMVGDHLADYLKGTNFSYTDLRNVSFHFTSSDETKPDFSKAILCHTIMPDGTISNRDCEKVQ